ncbi:hypothetical protein [Paraliomyxa miuraensis]|uniref:hypothetical protein n=1 Tax=Paraliomyxa miuraensis TaxID=376150 RepID=UPI00224DFDB9|nr:hypothetical protein [Paraliomyxa miuraensis]MCX4247200.1 hypothetical protein [Paraliomyxa miuraensis]
MHASATTPDRLAALSRLEPPSPGDGRTYVAELGLTPDDVPELVEFARRWIDPRHFEGHDEDSLAVWAPIHAWRALGELGAGEVISTLLEMLDTLDEQGDQWYLEIFHELCAQIGPSAIAELEPYVFDSSHHEYARISAAHGLQAIAMAEPASRDRVVGVLASCLEHSDEIPSLNGFLVSYLTDLRAIEHADLIEDKFRVGAIETMICGDWRDIEYELRTGRRPPRRRPTGLLGAVPSQKPPARAKTSKSARKQQKQSRRRNRR